MNHRAAADGIALVRPLYHAWPDDDRAYEVPNEFLFGSELVVAPITAPRDPVTLRGSARAWLPPGAWVDVFTQVAYAGDRTLELHRDGRSIPALLRAGGILPLAAPDDLDATRNPERLEVLVAPGADGAFTLVEDDGTGAALEDIPVARTPIAWSQAEGELVIGPAEGAAGVVPERRTWTVTFLGLDRSETLADVPAGEAVRVRVDPDPRPRTAALRDRLFSVLNAAQWGHREKERAWRTLTSDLPAGAMIAELHAEGTPRALAAALEELLTAR
jgi:hypothetical protein